MLADAAEALVGAIFVEHGRRAAEGFIQKYYLPTMLDEVDLFREDDFLDLVSRVTMHVQGVYRRAAKFEVCARDPNRVLVQLRVGTVALTQGVGDTIREAKIDAASRYWDMIQVKRFPSLSCVFSTEHSLKSRPKTSLRSKKLYRTGSSQEFHLLLHRQNTSRDGSHTYDEDAVVVPTNTVKQAA